MTIAIDLSSLQGGHRMRGIGYTLINLINNIPIESRQKHRFVFYYYTDLQSNDPLELLKLDEMKYEVRNLRSVKRTTKRLPGKLNFFMRLLNKCIGLQDLYRGDSRITDLEGVDVFLQTDQMVSLPRGKVKKILVAYDIIPYVLEHDYLWNYRTARTRGLPRQAALRCAGRRWLYIHTLRVNVRRASRVVAISQTTKRDFLKYVTKKEAKIVAIPLGVNMPDSSAQIVREAKPPALQRYHQTSWGYTKRPYKFTENTPYILFVGGADYRRKLDDVVVAFNHLRAQGYNTKLVLAGDTMRGPMSIPTENIQNALATSSYIDDIIFMGFVNDRQRNWLYENALVFVYPSIYEGFGLPVLEAMSYGTPVISYINSATKEVASDRPTYVNSSAQLFTAIRDCLTNQKAPKSIAENIKQAKKYPWEKTVKNLFDIFTD